MKWTFYKYHGAGNDFIIFDNRKKNFPADNVDLIQNLCHRHFGIGADGLMLLEESETSDFKMVYYNSDGKIGSMCGNGGRCIVAFAKKMNLFSDKTVFEAADGIHHASIVDDHICLGMSDVTLVESYPKYLFLNTGSPHHVQIEEDLENLDVYATGKKIRYGAPYFEKGSNVNFVKITDKDHLMVRTYERGVENETLSCGTGVTASAIAMYHSKKVELLPIHIKTLGGDLKVDFQYVNSVYQNVTLTGPALHIFTGEIEF